VDDPRDTRVHIDFETVSTQDLRRRGAHAYAEHPDTRVIILGYAFDGEAPCTWVPGQPFPTRLARHVFAGGEVHAWNAPFELSVWNLTLARLLPEPRLRPEQTHCTMAAAAYWGLPLSLEQAANALKLPHGKDKLGHALMLRMTKPRRFTDDGKPVYWHDEDLTRYRLLQDYCRQDVLVEREVSRNIPPLPARERDIWLVDRRMNAKGIKVDHTLVDALDKLTRAETARLDADMRSITGGAANTRTVAALTNWLQAKGVIAASLDKAHMGALLDDPRLPGDVTQALLIRQEAAKTSTAKLKALKTASSRDGRVRGSMQYYGANRTGRWAGRLTQIQNFPRTPKGFPVKHAIESVLLGDDPETLNLQFGGVLRLISVLLRPCFVADTGNSFVSVDLAQIEARVVAWLAEQDDMLEVFARGEDPYLYAASQIGSRDRQLGKVMTLALGFGMGPDKFVATAQNYGIALDPVDAKSIVYAWRDANRRIVALWYDCERAARSVIEEHEMTRWREIGRLGFRMARNTGPMRDALLMRLPSGRVLVYRDAQIVDNSITYSGINQYTRNWEELRTYGGKLVENAVQATARDLMADLLVGIDRRWPGTLIASIHDEAVMEVPAVAGDQVLSEVLELVRSGAGSPWAGGLPVDGDGYTARRYAKPA